MSGVFLAVPSLSGQPCRQFLDSLERTVHALEGAGFTPTFALLKGSIYIQHARNTLVADFMASGCQTLFFLDDDLGWPTDAVLRLLETPYTLACGAYPLKQPEPDYPIVIRCDDEGIPLLTSDGWLYATHAPTGFLRIDRSVIERLQAAFPERRYTDYRRDGTVEREAFDLFPQGVQDGRWWGEDFGFCNLAASIGVEARCWPDIDFQHVARDGTIYAGNYHRYLLSLPR
jgi:hypothetical protein